MQLTACTTCGSSDIAMSNFRPKDFPPHLYFIDCRSCGASLGVVDIYNVIDAYKGGSRVGKQLASTLLSHNHELA